MTEERIQELINKGFQRWTKGNMDRLYINAKQLGLKCTYYKTGNISGAWFDGEEVSHARAGKMIMAKTYIDIKTGELIGTDDFLKREAAKLAGMGEE